MLCYSKKKKQNPKIRKCIQFRLNLRINLGGFANHHKTDFFYYSLRTTLKLFDWKILLKIKYFRKKITDVSYRKHYYAEVFFSEILSELAFTENFGPTEYIRQSFLLPFLPDYSLVMSWDCKSQISLQIGQHIFRSSSPLKHFIKKSYRDL